MRPVIDTNIWISHLLLPDSTPARAVRHALQHGTVLMSDALLLELSAVLSRGKFTAYLSPEERVLFLHKLHKIVEPTPIIQRVGACRDANDNMLLELAVNGRATVIITGDKDLLVLHPFRGIAITTPMQYLT